MFGEITGSDIKITNEQLEDRNPDLYVERAELALKQGRINDAVDEINKAVRYSERNTHIYVLEQIRVLKACKKKNECIRVINGAIRSLYDKLSEKEFNEVLRAYRYSSANILDLKRLLENSDIEPMLCFLCEKQDYDNEKFYLKMASDIRGNYGSSMAIEFLAYITSKKETSYDLLSLQGQYYEEQGNIQGALLSYESMLKDLRGYGEKVYPKLIGFCKKHKLTELALHHSREFLKINPSDMEAILYIYEDMFHKNNYEACIAFLMERLPSICDNKDKGLAYLRLAECYDLLGKDMKATHYYRQAIATGVIDKIPQDRLTKNKTRKRRIKLLILSFILTTVLGLLYWMLREGTLPAYYNEIVVTGKHSLILVGEETKLEYNYMKFPTFAKEETTSYESSDETLASVNADGLVKAHKAGNVEIYFLINDKKYYTYNLEIVDAKVENLSIGSERITGTYGDYSYIRASVDMNLSRAQKEKIKYRSLDDNIVKVDKSGKVEFCGIGDCIVNVRAGSVVKEVKISVSPKVDRILVNGDTGYTLSLEKGDESKVSFQVETTPKVDVSSEIQYRIEDTHIASISNGIIYAKNPGRTELVVTVLGADQYFDIVITPNAEVVSLEVMDEETSECIDELEMKVGRKAKISPSMTYFPSTARSPKLELRVSDDSKDIISIDQNGTITALSEGDARIIVSAGNMEKVVSVHVIPLRLSDLCVENIRYEYLGNNEYSISWDPIEGYEHASYYMFSNHVRYNDEPTPQNLRIDYARSTSHIITVDSRYEYIEFKIRVDAGFERSEFSESVKLYWKDILKVNLTMNPTRNFVFFQYNKNNGWDEVKHYMRLSGEEEFYEVSDAPFLSDLEADMVYDCYIVGYVNGKVVAKSNIIEYQN